MGLINVAGYYKGHIVDAGLGQSSGGFPQEVLALKATEVYDPDGQEYLPADDEHDEIMAYLILISSKDKETKSAQQLKKITGWDGASFVDLANMDLTDVELSFRVEENTYEGNTTLQVQWVAEPDATPGRTVTKLDPKDVEALQARYAGVLAKNKKAPAPVSAKGKGKGKAAAKAPARPAAPKAPTKPAAKTEPVGKCSPSDAYNECYALGGVKENGDAAHKKLNEIWLAEVAKVNKDESKITEEQWFEIKTTILKQVSKV
jgi:hypothetical protein